MRRDADAGEGEDAILCAHGEVAVENDVGDEFAVFAEDDVGADGAVGADRAACGDLSSRCDDGCGVDAHSAGASCFFDGAGNDLAHDRGVADEFSVDGDGAAHLYGSAAPVEDGYFDAELIAGGDGAAEAGVFDTGEDHEFGVAVGDLVEEERAAGLGDGFDHEDAGHDGVVGEVALKVGLVDGDVFDGDDALLALHLDNAVDEEEGIAVRQEGHDLEDVHRLLWRLFVGGLVGRGFAHGKDEYNGMSVMKRRSA